MGKKGFAGNKERKRGRKKSKVSSEAPSEPDPATSPQGHTEQPSWIASSADEVDPTAPFGFVDSDVKTYFKDLFAQLKASESTVIYGQDELGSAEDSEHALLVQAALREADGRVLVLATDPDTSVVLEYLIGHLKGKSLRILMDRMSGSLFTLAKHRFGSHVLQSTLAALQPLVSEEVQPSPSSKHTSFGEHELGHLRSASQFVLDAVDELQPKFSTLIQDSFGTHILRVLLFLLAGRPVEEGDQGKGRTNPVSARSKRSTEYRAKEIVSMAGPRTEPAVQHEPARVPASFETMLERVRAEILSGMGSNEVHAIAVSPIAAPVLAIFLEFEARSPNPATRPEAPNSLHDLLLDGLATYVHEEAVPGESESLPDKTDFTETMLRDTVGSLTLQAALTTASPKVTFLFFKIYLVTRLIKLATHPVANFVVSTVVRRMGWIMAQAREHMAGITPQEGAEAEEIFQLILSEVKAAGNKVVKEKKTNLFTSLLEAASVGDQEGVVTLQNAAIDALCSSFWIPVSASVTTDSTQEIVPMNDPEHERETLLIILSLQTRKDWLKSQPKAQKSSAAKVKSRKKDAFSQATEDDSDDSSEEEETNPSTQPQTSARTAVPDEIQADTQGSLLLQTMARMSFPANDILHRRYVFPRHPMLNCARPILTLSLARMYSSLRSQTATALLGLCKSSSAVHVILAMLTSSTSNFQQKKKLIDLLLPQLGALADDRWGSRVTDAIWDAADVFVRSKIVRQAQKQEKYLLTSQYGRFLLKRLNLGMFRKSQERWRDWAKQFVPSSSLSLREETLQALRALEKEYSPPSSSRFPNKQALDDPQTQSAQHTKRKRGTETHLSSKSKKSKKERKMNVKSKSKSDKGNTLDAQLDSILAEAE